MESSERRSFGSRQGEKSDAVQAPLAFRDDVRGPKNQVQAIAEKTSFSWFYLTAGGVFSALTSSKSSTDAMASLCGLLLVRCEKFIHSDCFQLNKTRSRIRGLSGGSRCWGSCGAYFGPFVRGRVRLLRSHTRPYCRALLRRKGSPRSMTSSKLSATGRQTASP
jgi:hypothetical protein